MKHSRGEETGRDCSLLSSVMVRPFSMHGCLFTDTREEDSEVGGDGLRSSHGLWTRVLPTCATQRGERREEETVCSGLAQEILYHPNNNL